MIELDRELLLFLNGSDNLFMDNMMIRLTSTVTWVPVILALLYVILKNKPGRDALFVILSIVLAVLLSDQISSSIIKPLICRLRPSHEPDIMFMVNAIHGRGGLYGFLSSHAANTFAAATLVSLIIRRRYLTLTLFIWASLCSYSRIYLGVHYPGDVLCGAILGAIIGYLVYCLLGYCTYRFCSQQHKYYSDAYTSSGYNVQDIAIIQTVFVATFLYVIF